MSQCRSVLCCDYEHMKTSVQEPSMLKFCNVEKVSSKLGPVSGQDARSIDVKHDDYCLFTGNVVSNLISFVIRGITQQSCNKV